MLERNRHKNNVPLHERLNLLLHAVMVLAYLGLGVYILINQNTIVNNMGGILGGLMLAYGIFRGVRVYQRFQNQKNHE